jgi:hypothetical protein
VVGVDCFDDGFDLLIGVSIHMFRVELSELIDCDDTVMIMINLIEYFCEFLPFLLGDVSRCDEALQCRDEIVAALGYEINT